MTAPALPARGVVVRFGGLTAVDGVDLEIEDRTLVGIIGPNGAGKTTFFNALCGLVTPATGRLFVGGADLTRKPAHVFARAGVARTFQTPRVFADMTVAESVRFGLEFAGHRRRAERAALADVPAILEFLGLADFASSPAGAVTPARQRLLEIGMALATRPRVLLLDEVAAGLTEAEVRSMARRVRSGPGRGAHHRDRGLERRGEEHAAESARRPLATRRTGNARRSGAAGGLGHRGRACGADPSRRGASSLSSDDRAGKPAARRLAPWQAGTRRPSRARALALSA